MNLNHQGGLCLGHWEEEALRIQQKQLQEQLQVQSERNEAAAANRLAQEKAKMAEASRIQLKQLKEQLEQQRKLKEAATRLAQEQAKQAEASRKLREAEDRLAEERLRVDQAAAAEAARTMARQRLQAQRFPKPAWMAGYEGHVNVGFVGQSGVGKSSMINVCLGLADSDPLAAKTDIWECTMQAMPFTSVTFTSGAVTFWDLPGAGTTEPLLSQSLL